MIFELSALLNNSHPNLEDFTSAVKSIEEDALFNEDAKLFIINKEEVGRFFVEMDKPVSHYDKRYRIYTEETPNEFLNGLFAVRKGYEISLSNGKVARAVKMNNPVFVKGFEVLYFERRIDLT